MLMTSFVSQKKTRVIFFGDSITQAGVNAGGYIMRIDSICKAEGKTDNYEFIGAGIGAIKYMICIYEWKMMCWQKIRMSLLFILV